MLKDGSDSMDEYLVANVIKATVNIPQKVLVETDSDLDSKSSESSQTTNEEITQQSERDGVEYLAGWVAKKLKNIHPELGSYTKNLKSNHNYIIPKWITYLSYGGLIQPSED